MKKIIPYILPILTIVISGSIIFIPSSFTGLAITEINPTLVTVSTHLDTFLPQNALIIVTVEEQTLSLSAEEFIHKTREKFQLTDRGYTGEYIYQLDLQQFGFTSLPEHYLLIVQIVHEGTIISSFQREITSS